MRYPRALFSSISDYHKKSETSLTSPLRSLHAQKSKKNLSESGGIKGKHTVETHGPNNTSETPKSVRSKTPNTTSTPSATRVRPSVSAAFDSDVLADGDNLGDIADENLEEEDSLKQLILKSHRSLVKNICDLKGLVIFTSNRMKKMETKIENIPVRPIERNAEMNDIEIEEPDLIALPCSTMVHFDEFNDALEMNLQYRSKIKTIIGRSVDKQRSLARCLGDLIQRFVTVDVAKFLVPMKATKDKRVFNDTR